MPRLSSRTRAADFITGLSRYAAATPMPTQPAPVAELAGLRTALAPAEAIRAGAQALDEMTLRERPCRGFPGSTWVSLRMRNSIGSSRSFSAISSMAISMRHRSRRIARRAHGIAFGQIEHRKPCRRHAVGAGIDQARRPDRGLRLAAGQIARPALMADRGDLAVLGRADADALDGRRPVHGVVEHQAAASAPPSPAVWPRARRAPPATHRPG